MSKLFGLSSAEVREREKDGLTNKTPDRSSRSVIDILRANILTRFNALLAILAVAVIVIDRSPFNALFGLAMIINSGVGIFQELRAKRTLDKLAILSAPHVVAIRDGKKQEIQVDEVVKDDIIVLRLGDQIVADGQVVDSEGLEIDESLLTGESDPIIKQQSDPVLSGSIVVAGRGLMLVEKVGAASYSSHLTTQAKKFQRASSELMSGINQLLKWISRLLIVVAPILVLGQLRLDFGNWRDAIIHATAAIVGMIPEGLVLLTSAAFMLATITLARRKVLVQQMPAVETLARVDMLLLDKTGTLTEGNIRFEAVILAEAGSLDDTIEKVLATMAHRAKSPTNDAIGAALKHVKPLKFSGEVPFSSARKWSAISVRGEHWILGAPEILSKGRDGDTLYNKVPGITRQGKRILALASSKTAPSVDHLPDDLTPHALVVLTEKIRDDAAQILEYFAEQNVAIKVISGDSPLTVGAVARAVGLGNVKVFDARELPDPEKQSRKFAKIITTHNVFGRVQPEQKRSIATALQTKGFVVAMTGDGVNDALALKKADLGIAMSSGSAAAKAVAEIVLLDNKFSHLPRVLAEGRRVIANIERVANLFVIKNVYSLVLALCVTVAGLTYPYLPAQMTVISTLSIGIPAFFLALAPNNAIYRSGFLRRVLKFAIPVGVIAAAAMMVCYALVYRRGMSMDVAGTSVSIVVMMIVFWVLILLARPLRGWKLGLIAACAAAFVAIIFSPIATWFNYEIDFSILPLTLVIGLAGAAAVTLVKKLNVLPQRKK
ncbi:HAD-IC family P-type ATPase [Candidatus Saccharibacteria bacterium]|nr:HAD-IC family P-type ATPase [Candidatus Saccharibacteria bacterium]